jgi:thioesterase domain-containing protein
MSTAKEFLSQLQRLDVRLWIAGDRLRYSAPTGVVTPELLGKLKEHKQELMALLPTPTQVLQSATRTVRPDSPLVIIQSKGTRLPLFCPAPSGGTVYGYADLSRALGPDQPLYAFQTPGLDGTRELLTRVEDMAAHYIEAMQEVHPRSPFILVAWSFGGVVAFEMAQQLRARGERVPLLVMIDTPHPSFLPEGLEDDVALLVTLLRMDVPLHMDSVRAKGSPREQLAYILEEGKRAGVYQAELELDQLCHFMKVHRTNNQAAKAYVPKPYDGRITFFRPAEEDETGFLKSPDDPTLGWRNVPSHGVDVHSIPGNHLNLMSSPHLEVLVAKLKACLDAVQ